MDYSARGIKFGNLGAVRGEFFGNLGARQGGKGICRRSPACSRTGHACVRSFRIYRNYDGVESCVGNQLIPVEVAEHPDRLTAYAARRDADGAVTLILIHKELEDPIEVLIEQANGVAAGPGEFWQGCRHGFDPADRGGLAERIYHVAGTVSELGDLALIRVQESQ